MSTFARLTSLDEHVQAFKSVTAWSINHRIVILIALLLLGLPWDGQGYVLITLLILYAYNSHFKDAFWMSHHELQRANQYKTWLGAVFNSLLFLRVLPVVEITVGLFLYERYGVWEWFFELTRPVALLLGVKYPSIDSVFIPTDLEYTIEGLISWFPALVLSGYLVEHFIYLMLDETNRSYFTRPLLYPEEEEAMQAPATQGGNQSPQNQAVYEAKNPRYKFKDVVGLERTKSRLKEVIDGFMKEGGNGILLSGDPGNGKSMLAEAIAGELGWKFLEARANELTSMWMGESAMRVVQIFKDARSQAPVVLFLDEVDTFLTDRGAMTGLAADQNNRATANALLTEIAALNKELKKHKVLIVAATNFRDELDEAGTREGRFDAKVEVEPPNFKARMTLLMLRIPKDAKIDRESVEMLVRRWEDWSSSRILEISRRAKKKLEKNPNQVIDANFLRSIVDELAEGVGTRLSEMVLTFKDLQFTPELRDRLLTLAKMVKEPELVERVGATVPRGAIFYGPPGTGKTAAAQAFAKEVGCRFIATSASDLLSNPKRIDEIVKKARNARPAIIFIDEAYDLLKSRQMNPIGADVTNKLLSVMDGPRKLHDVFFIAATNFVDDLDEAMLRPGRFSEHLDFTPTKEVLIEYVRHFVRRNNKVAWKGSVEAFVERHSELTQSNIKGLLDNALQKAALNAPKGARVTINLNEL